MTRFTTKRQKRFTHPMVGANSALPGKGLLLKNAWSTDGRDFRIRLMCLPIIFQKVRQCKDIFKY